MVAISVGVTAGVAAVVTAVGLVVNHVVPESYMVRAVTALQQPLSFHATIGWWVGVRMLFFGVLPVRRMRSSMYLRRRRTVMATTLVSEPPVSLPTPSPPPPPSLVVRSAAIHPQLLVPADAVPPDTRGHLHCNRFL
jgi:hypothetical protein